MQRAILLSLAFCALTSSASSALAGAGALLVEPTEPTRLELLEIRTPQDLHAMIEQVVTVDDAFVAERILRAHEGKFLARDFRSARQALDERKLALGIGADKFL